ncbi:MAG: hypothetical protein M0Z39_11610 [Actinomycetota bacterium]|nr:hypothetical protein [Actinomycetota bacterium]
MPQIILLSVFCYLFGSIVASSSVSYVDRRIALHPVFTLGMAMLAILWLAMAVELFTLLMSVSGTMCALTLGSQLVIFPLLATIDLKVRQVPTFLVRVGSLWTLLVLLLGGGSSLLARAALMTALYVAPLLLVNLLKPRSIGMGDVRLGIYVGPLLSFSSSLLAIPLVLAASSAFALVASCVARLIFGMTMKRIPLVPFILLATLILQFTPGWLPIR